MNILGVDVGYGVLKVVGGREDFVVPSMGQGMFAKRSTAALAKSVAKDMDGKQDGYEVLVNGEKWLTCFDPSRLVTSARPIADDYTSTSQYRALFHTALLLNGQESIDLLVTGLPIDQFKTKGAAAALEAQLRGVHEIAPGRFVTVAEVKVIGQPYGGFMDFALRADDIDVTEATIVVIDPGSYSVDWSVFVKMASMADLNSTSTKACTVLMERVATLIKDAFGHSVSVSDIETKLIQGKNSMLVGGRDVDIGPFVRTAAEEIVDDVAAKIIPKIRAIGRSPDRVVLVGGGARFYEGAMLRHFGDGIVRMSSEPVVANARGFYLYGCTKKQQLQAA